MSLPQTAALVMGLAQDGKAHQALDVAADVLDDQLSVAAAAPTDLAALWYAVAVARHILPDHVGAFTAADRCVTLAQEAGNPGWASNGLSMRAMALARQERVEAAVVDLARAEVELAACDDPGLRCWAHTGLGYCYLELRLYELAEPHLVAAQRLDASPIPLASAPVIDLLNLAELHLRWADELERVFPWRQAGAEIDDHRARGHGYAQRALAAALAADKAAFVASCRAVELCARPRQQAESALPELREAFGTEDHPDYQGSRAVVGGALARALWVTGEREEAVEVAREAARMSATAGDWQVTASAQWLLVELEAQAGVPGATAGRSYAGLLSRVLWTQRLSTLQGAQAALQVERLHRDKLQAQRAASEDPLTGVGNRRALDDAVAALQAEALRHTAGQEADVPVSLVVVDLDRFKAVNDTWGHVVGDEVLRAVAMAVRGVARAEDVVARLGGDEFVVLARGADEETGQRLAARIREAVSALRVGTRGGAVSLAASVGVSTADSGHDLAALLDRADAAMYDVKASTR